MICNPNRGLIAARSTGSSSVENEPSFQAHPVSDTGILRRLEPAGGYDIIRFLLFAESVVLRVVVATVATPGGLDKRKLALVFCGW